MLTRKLKRAVTILTDHRWWGFYAQRRITNPQTRARWASYVATRRPGPLPPQSESDNIASDLRYKGFAKLGKLMTAEQCKELYEYFKGKNAFDPYRPEVPPHLPLSNSRNAAAHVLHHRPEDVLRAPYLVDIANSPRMLAAASSYLGCKPTIGYLASWWSFATGKGAQHAENFHRDVDDWRFLKLFIYITDVNQTNGPHVYVLNSSADPKLIELRRLDDDEVSQAFGQENILTLTGKAGDAFIEDTYGIHKGLPVIDGSRLIFQVVYSMSPLPYSPKEPCLSRSTLANFTHDPWINRVYVR